MVERLPTEFSASRGVGGPELNGALVLYAKSIKGWAHLHQARLREPTYCHLRAATFPDVMPLVWCTDSIFKRRSHVLPEAHFPA
jgi:hypothetical protein